MVAKAEKPALCDLDINGCREAVCSAASLSLGSGAALGHMVRGQQGGALVKTSVWWNFQSYYCGLCPLC
ncbi:hypothetical protein ANANG_G00094230 [Anguilla anguilla]|uniref:Uncharacterized protein n=1 Tax=Anguilla anguilla TaxID=7936 RepID=A0A9D3MME0_ANGAN|nr:hypothetical protein ANANG_G00094230 [Anguilla anguilla]